MFNKRYYKFIILALLLMVGIAGAITEIDSCTTISEPGYYMLNKSIINIYAENCIYIKSSDVIFDGVGYTIDSLERVGTGINVNSYKNVTLKRLILTDWSRGINANIENGSITDNRVSNTGYGIYLDSSKNIILDNNNFSFNSEGIYIHSSSNLTISNNILNDNSWAGIQIENFRNSTLSHNIASNNRVYGFDLLGNGGGSENNNLSYNTVTENGHGIHLGWSENSILDNNIASNNQYYGISLGACSSSKLSNNIASNNYAGDGISLNVCSGSNLSNNIVSNNFRRGIELSSSDNVILSNNFVSDNGEFGIRLLSSNNNTLSDNNIRNNNYGIYFSDAMNNNTIYNNLFNNTNNYGFLGNNYNYWNTTKKLGINIVGGSYLGGNFWAKPDGNGYSQKCVDSEPDGFCDLPYSLYSNNIDYMPLSLQFPSDLIEPTTIIELSGTLGNNDWYISDVQVTFTATDNEGGSGIARTEYSIDGGVSWIQYSVPFTISDEGTTSIQYKSTDNAGNVEQAKNQMIQIDKTAPSISGVATTSPNANDWYKSDVTIQFTASDEGSGIDTVTPDTTISTEAASQSVSGIAIDKAGNSASATVSGINIDKTAPSISGAATTSPNANDWYKSDVTIQFTASDAGSGIDTVTPDTTISTEAASQSVSGTAVDKAGNSASATVLGINIDKTAPSITIIAPIDGKEYLLNQPLFADWSASDIISGIDSSTGTYPNGGTIDTSLAGIKTFIVEAEDNAGNSMTKTVTYHVNFHFNFTGFFQPIDNLPLWNTVKAKSAIPTKFSLDGYQGLDIFSTGYPMIQKINCDTTAPTDVIEETITAGSSSLSYNASSDQYNYVWKTDKTWAGSCRQLTLLLKDGTYHNASFKFLK